MFSVLSIPLACRLEYRSIPALYEHSLVAMYGACMARNDVLSYAYVLDSHCYILVTYRLRLYGSSSKSSIMASTAIHGPSGHQTSFEPLDVKVQTTAATQTAKPHHVDTTLNYYKDPGDGSEPHPSYVGKPETYERPTEQLEVRVNDIRGNEKSYTLDRNGFQIYEHESKEKAFLDDEQIKAVYYPETEQLLKDAYVFVRHLSIPFSNDHT